MLTPSHVLLRRRGTGHVVKYLEGVPTPSKLIDHLAGADLHASAELAFFNTVPRYVDTQHEHRMSKLFFHHVLYPAGGARLPYQVVVVRGGRAVRTSTPRLWHKTTAGARGKKEEVKGKDEKRTSSSVLSAANASDPSPPRRNPLVLPASQLGSSAFSISTPATPNIHSSDQKITAATTTTTTLMEEVPSSAAWARVDPARRSFFFTQAFSSPGRPNRFRNTRADSGPAASSRHVPPFRAGVQGTVPSTRPVEDDVLTPLRGVVEHYWNSASESTAQAKPSVPADRLQKLLVSPLAGLLRMSEKRYNNGEDDVSPLPDISHSSNSSSSVLERFIESVQQRAINSAGAAAASTSTLSPAGNSPQQSAARTVSTFAYVQTRLPPAATVALPIERNSDDSQLRRKLSQAEREPSRKDDDERDAPLLCRMAGGVEPAVPFAVGRPLTDPSVSSPSPSDHFFSHISCLTRLNLRVSWSKTSPSTAPSFAQRSIEQRTRNLDAKEKVHPAHATAEPWKLGDDGLDLMVPQQVRTVVERHPAKSLQRDAHTSSATTSDAPQRPCVRGDRYVLGRADAETYLIPQRELLLTLYVPAHTEDMCAAQNNDRLRRQVRAGRASPSAAMAWPTDQTRMTSSRRALGQYANAESATQTGNSQLSAFLSSSLFPQGPEVASPSELFSRTSYEVRALPGDVVYIPRSWGYDVQRILGTATIHKRHRNAANGGEPRCEFRDHRALADKSGSSTCTPPTRIASPKPSLSPPSEEGEAIADIANVAVSSEISSIEVDAFCLSYHPYPELTAAQAAVYVAANYVHTGVEEFYEKGGNEVYRSYE